MKTLDQLFTLATNLADRVGVDIGEHGGLTSSDTIRAADELRLELSRFKPMVAELDRYVRHRDDMPGYSNFDTYSLHQMLKALDE